MSDLPEILSEMADCAPTQLSADNLIRASLHIRSAESRINYLQTQLAAANAEIAALEAKIEARDGLAGVIDGK